MVQDAVGAGTLRPHTGPVVMPQIHILPYSRNQLEHPMKRLRLPTSMHDSWSRFSMSYVHRAPPFHILPYSRNHSELPIMLLRLQMSMHDSSFRSSMSYVHRAPPFHILIYSRNHSELPMKRLILPILCMHGSSIRFSICT